jgi:hypothetical protein
MLLNEHIIVINKSSPEIDLSVRVSGAGEEQRLVQSFLEFTLSESKKRLNGTRLLVFLEPRLITGYPDIVIAVYNPKILDSWSTHKKRLRATDLKVLSVIQQVNGIDGLSLKSILRLREDSTLYSLETLLAAKLIEYNDKKWKIREFNKYFCINKLIAIEAKVSDFRRVIDQSYINTWFASESYAMIKKREFSSTDLMEVKTRGIGMINARENFDLLVSAKQLPLPSSYLSLQFNEWIGNYLTSS